jgi:hypothetical protein
LRSSILQPRSSETVFEATTTKRKNKVVPIVIQVANSYPVYKNATGRLLGDQDSSLIHSVRANLKLF